MKMGDRFILTNTPPYSMWYKDYHNKKKPKFIWIEIKEVSFDVPGEFSGEPVGNGFLAVGSDGFHYEYNYKKYYQGLGERGWNRWMEDEEFSALSEKEQDAVADDMYWYDITHYQCPQIPNILDRFNKFVSVNFCEKHQKLYYDSKECFYCKYELNERKNLNAKEHSWIGWFI